MKKIVFVVLFLFAFSAFAQEPKKTEEPAKKAEPTKVEEKKVVTPKVTVEGKVTVVDKKEEKKEVPTSLPAAVPKTVDEAIEKGKEAFEFAKVKNWFGMSAAIIWILMLLFKMFGLFKKIGKRWAYILVPVLSLGAMLCAKFAGGLSWTAAIAVMTSGPAVALLNDFVKRGILGKEPVTAMKPKAEEAPSG